MHLLLTDRLTCPRCGPDFGLILLAEQMVDRRVREGTLGCPNCRDSFPVHDGFADVRAPPRGDFSEGRGGEDPGSAAEAGSGPAEDEPAEEASRIVALLGIRQGPGTVVTAGSPVRLAAELAASVEELQVVAVDPDTRAWEDRPGVTRMAASPGLPFFSRMLRGAVVDGTLGRGLIFEAARVVAPMSRVVVVDAAEEAVDILEEAGLSVLAAESGTVVAARG